MYVALLAISSLGRLFFGCFFLLGSSCEFLDSNFFGSGKWRLWGGGGVEVELISGSTEFCTFCCSPKAAVSCSNSISWNTISELTFPCEIFDRFLTCQLGRQCKNAFRSP